MMTTAPSQSWIALSRDCSAILIPAGERIVLRLGDLVSVVQHRGGAATVRTQPGRLVRVDRDDLDALGIERSDASSLPASTEDAGFDIARVVDQLRRVFDPEIPVNVVDLGLIYHLDAQPHSGGGFRVEIAMSMTAPGCGMGEVLREEARDRVVGLPGVSEVTVELVWEPPWTIDRMSEAARLELGLL